jgi:hypothetical protein
MKKSLFYLALFLGTASAQAGHFYNTSDLNDLRDGAALNRSSSLGFSGSHQAVLVSPRLVVTAPHQSSGDKSENFGISFYGQQYTVIHSIDRPGLDVCTSDLRLYVLDRDVIHPDGKTPCSPVATQLMDVSQYTYPQGVVAHSLSHSPNIKLKGQNTQGNGRHSVLYGRTHVDFASARRNDSDMPFFDEICAGTLPSSLDKDMMVPIGGDSGSALYVSLQDGGNAVWGVMSGVDNGAGTSASYTSLSQNIGWLQNKEQALINRGLLPNDVVRIKTVSQNEWESHGECLTLPPEFDPNLYLSFNEDLALAAKDHPHPLQFAQHHFLNHGRAEKREWRLPITFSTELYLAYNQDLQHAVRTLNSSEREHFLINHFSRFGRHEGRHFSFPKDFDPISYLTLNSDIAKAAHTHHDPLSFATQHFKKFGIKEKRPYFDPRFTDFDPTVYLALNHDVAQAAKTHPNPSVFALWHFTVNGLHENRRCKSPLPQDFDPEQYLVINMDLSVHLAEHPELDPHAFAVKHYQTHGCIEKRLYK